ncbi:hypothetical protein Ciccas_003125 [Cichlidogyrus casuarinus]|uniref:Uncharacterized protein n=1 Tax=Cichlidogyrus casuarinus TaxID=1844966 RepID=A0ABD2QFH2_9PLAT
MLFASKDVFVGLAVFYVFWNLVTILYCSISTGYWIYSVLTSKDRMHIILENRNYSHSIRNGDLLLVDFGTALLNIAICTPSCLLCVITTILVLRILIRKPWKTFCRMLDAINYMNKRLVFCVSSQVIMSFVYFIMLIIYIFDRFRLEEEVLRSYHRVFHRFYDYSDVKIEGTFASLWEQYQTDNHCCGIYFFRDFGIVLPENSSATMDYDLPLPASCCDFSLPLVNSTAEGPKLKECGSWLMSQLRPPCDNALMSQSPKPNWIYSRWVWVLFCTHSVFFSLSCALFRYANMLSEIDTDVFELIKFLQIDVSQNTIFSKRPLQDRPQKHNEYEKKRLKSISEDALLTDQDNKKLS